MSLSQHNLLCVNPDFERGPTLQEQIVHRLFKAVANSTYDWESWHDTYGDLLWVNPAVERITGFTVNECLAMENYPLPLIDPRDQQRVKKILASAVEGTTGGDVEFRSIHKNHEIRWMSLAWQPMSDGIGTPLGFRTSIRDVTERRRLRDQLKKNADELEVLVEQRTAELKKLELRQRQMEKQAALGQLAAGIAHEINNPLAGMRNAFELFRSCISKDNPNYELLELIDREIERISAITHQMYQLYHREPRPLSGFCLVRALDDTIRLLEGVAHEKDVAVQRIGSIESFDVLLSEGEARQILMNLTRNAIQASPSNGRVTLELTIRNGEAVVEVCDQGNGIPQELATRVFEPFFTTKHELESPGMGLGLSVSLSLIEAMNGRIEFENTEQGTKFSAIFPITNAQLATAGTSSNA